MSTTQSKRVPIDQVDEFSPINCPYEVEYYDGVTKLISASENTDLAFIEGLLKGKDPGIKNIYFRRVSGTIIKGYRLTQKGEWELLPSTKANARRRKQIEKGILKVNVQTTTN